MTESGPPAPAGETIGTAGRARRAEDAFRARVEAYRADLYGHCRRMLVSRHDADDAFQETLLRAWRALPRFRGDSSFRTWLYRIATNVCLDALARRSRGALPIEYTPSLELERTDAGLSSEGGWIAPHDATRVTDDHAASPDARYERREALESAFVASVRHLPERQRAALVLRDVLGFSATDAAASLGTTVASVNSALQRARAAVEERLPAQNEQATVRALDDRCLREVAERFADALERGDVERILALLTADAHVATAADQPRRSGAARNIARLEITATPGRRPADARRGLGGGRQSTQPVRCVEQVSASARPSASDAGSVR